jgi:RNA polymerase sigma-B factor
VSAGVDSAAALLDRFRRYKETGDRRLRNELVEAHLNVADHYAKRYRNRGVPVEDLRQTALLAMIRAVDRFDPDAGVTFSTFASRTVDGELKRWFRDRAWAVRPPRSTQERHLALRRSEDELTQKLGRSPTVKELAEALDESVEHVLEALEAGAARSASSLVRTNPDDEPGAMGEEIVPIQDRELGLVDERVLVEGLLDRLPERDRAVVEMRFFEGLGQEEIANRIGVSQSYLSRMLRRILIDLRQLVDEPAANEDTGA